MHTCDELLELLVVDVHVFALNLAPFVELVLEIDQPVEDVVHAEAKSETKSTDGIEMLFGMDSCTDQDVREL